MPPTGWPTPAGIAPEDSAGLFRWLVNLRWIAVLGVALVLVLSGPVFSALPAGTASGLWLTVAGLTLYNGILARLGPHRGWPWLTGLVGQIVMDCAALAILVHLAGGVENPFLPLFVLHVVNAGIVLSGRAAALVLGVAAVLVAAIVFGEGFGLVAHHCLRRPGEPCAGTEVNLWTIAIFGGLVLTLAMSSLFTRLLTEQLRLGQRRLATTVAQLRDEKQELASTRTVIETERAKLQAILDCMGDAVIFYEPEKNSLVSNRRARELWRLGASADDPPEFRAMLEAIWSRPTAGVGVTIAHGGRNFEATCSTVRSRGGDILGRVVAARDVTERLAMERHLMHEEQMSVVGKLAAMVAHEINNPIGVVCLFSQHALAKISAEDPVHQHLVTIRRNAESCREIVGSLLRLARSRQPERRRVDLRQICRDALDSVRLLAARAGVRISSGIHARAAPIWAHADPGMLHQAVLNLAVNAIEASHEQGEVTILAYETQDGEHAAGVIEVRDAGSGIPPELQERVFQPFFTTKASGTGLGLAVAASIINGHDGRVELDSVVGKGTRIRLLLPKRTDGDLS